MTLQALAIEVGKLLKQKQLVLTTAESCTGGGLSYWITTVPNSSEWFDRGFVTYSNDAKVDMLGVSLATLATYGAVSAETAQEMANGALQQSKATVSIAITGIAGPTGGTKQKPVGTVFIAWASAHFPTKVETGIFTGDRDAIRSAAIEYALSTLITLIG